MDLLKQIEQAIRHPADFVSFPKLPGESPSSHRRRLEAYAAHKVFKAHNPVLPLPTEQLTPRSLTRNHMQEQEQAVQAKTEQPASMESLMTLLKEMQDKINKLQAKGPRAAKKAKIGVRSIVKGKKGIGGAIEFFRRQQGLSAKHLGLKAGVAASIISGAERVDNAGIYLHSVLKICKALGISPSELFAKMEELDAAKE